MKQTNKLPFFKRYLMPILSALFIFLMMNTTNLIGQVVLTTESFDNATNITTPNTFCGGDNSGVCNTTNNIFNFGETCTTYTGGTGAFFWAQDVDACGSNPATTSIVISMLVPVGTMGDVVFSGLFADSPSTVPGYDVGDGATVEYSIDGGGSYALGLSVTRADDNSLQIGTTVLSTTFQPFGFNVGNNLGGVTVLIRVTFMTLSAGSEALALDEFQLLADCGLTLGCPIVACSGAGIYDVTVPYSGSESAAVIVTNNSASGTVTFDPTVADDVILISGIADTDDWSFTLSGGNCNEALSGTAPSCLLPTCPAVGTPPAGGITISHCFTGGNTTQAGQDAAADADPTLNTPYGTWVGAVNRAEIDGITTITFDAGYYMSDNTVGFAFGAPDALLAAVDGLTVYGNGSVIEQAVGGTQVSFIIIDGVNNITINDLNFINFDRTLGSVASIEDASNIVFNNITADGCDRGGDAFHITASGADTDVTFYCSDFYNHFSHNPPSSVMTIVGDGSTNEGSHTVTANFIDTEWRCNDRNGFGGALNITGGDNATPGPIVNFWGGVLANNIANSTDGGAIHASGDTNLFIDGTEFICNSSTSVDGSGGGAMFIEDDSNATILNANFSSNTSSLDGGAITFNGSGTLIVEGTEFHNNSAGGGAGGGIFFRGKNAVSTTGSTINNCYFDGNSQAIFFEGVGNLSPTDLTISNTTITGSTGTGVAITQSDVDEDLVTICSSLICGNTGLDLDQNFEPAELVVDALSVIGTGDAPQGDCANVPASLGYQGTPAAIACTGGACTVTTLTATNNCIAGCEECTAATCPYEEIADSDWGTGLTTVEVEAFDADETNCSDVSANAAASATICFEFTALNTDYTTYTPATNNADATCTAIPTVDFELTDDGSACGTTTATLTDNGEDATIAGLTIGNVYQMCVTVDYTGATCEVATVCPTLVPVLGEPVDPCLISTVTMDGTLDASGYIHVVESPFSAPIPGGSTTDSDFIGEGSAFSTNGLGGFANSADIQQLYVSWDNDHLYLAVQGPNGYNGGTDGMDLFIAIDTDNDIDPGTPSNKTLNAATAPFAKRIDFAGWIPDYFVSVERDGAGGGGYAQFSPSGAAATATDFDSNPPAGTGTFEYAFNFGNALTEVRIPWALLGGQPAAATGDQWNFAVYTTYDYDNFDGFDAAPGTQSGGLWEVIGDAPGDADYCTENDPVTGAPDTNCPGDGNGPGTGTAQSDDAIDDFDTIYEYFSITNVGEISTACYTVSGNAFHDSNLDGLSTGENPLENVTVTLIDCGTGTCDDGDEITFGTTMTLADGSYTFTNVPNGNYTVEFTTPTGYGITQQLDTDVETDTDDSDIDATDPAAATSQTPLFTVNGANVAGIDAGFANGSLSGTVFTDLDGNGLDDNSLDVAGVQVQLFDATTMTQILVDADGATYGTGGTITTNATGDYLFDNLPLGDYYVVFTNLPTDHVFAQQDVNSNGNDGNDSDVDITNGQSNTVTLDAANPTAVLDAGILNPINISGMVFEEVDGDGDSSNDGTVTSSNVTVTLVEATTGTPVTVDALGNAVSPIVTNGAYSFTNVPPGMYYVTFTTPTGTTITTPGTNSSTITDLTDANDSDIDGTGQTPIFTVASGDGDITNLDAGFVSANCGANSGNFGN